MSEVATFLPSPPPDPIVSSPSSRALLGHHQKLEHPSPTSNMAYTMYHPEHAGDYYPPTRGLNRHQADPHQSHSLPASSASATYATTYPAHYSTPHHPVYSTGPSPYPPPPRTLSPPSAMFNSVSTSTIMYSRNHYQPLEQESHYASASQPTPLPSQLIPSLPSSFGPFPLPRSAHRSAMYGDYPSPFQQQLTISPEVYGTSSFSSSSHAVVHSHQGLPPQQPSLPSPPPANCPTPVQIDPKEMNERFYKMAERLDDKVISRIRSYVGYRYSWSVSMTSRWFRKHFHPNCYTEQQKVADLLDLERWGLNGSDDSDKPSKKKRKMMDEVEVKWLACYHCYRLLGLHRFERYKHSTPRSTTTVARSNRESTRHSPYSPPTPRSSGGTPPASSNPHYDPSLTRTSLRANASRDSRMASPAESTESERAETRLEIRQKTTYTYRRFCIECGLKMKIYLPGDLVEVIQPPEQKPNYAIWVCNCNKLQNRADRPQCTDCGANCPFSTAVVAMRR
ncbi:hypothetical protein VTJ04DRAFT_1073 [Mycothermus thermophilus]|uniref:uncharacterized protein n=1 Tax=Humicola insolens TaxID=85995 RepID=UPI003743591B